jgi:hypothetical protein
MESRRLTAGIPILHVNYPESEDCKPANYFRIRKIEVGWHVNV